LLENQKPGQSPVCFGGWCWRSIRKVDLVIARTVDPIRVASVVTGVIGLNEPIRFLGEGVLGEEHPFRHTLVEVVVLNHLFLITGGLG